MTDRIFSYFRDNAWNQNESKLEIFDRESENVHAIKGHSNMPEPEVYSVSKDDLEKIKEFIDMHDEFFNDKFEVKDTPVLDGVIHNFDIYKGDIKKEISVLNLHQLDKGTDKNADLLLDLFSKIQKVLEDAGVREKYFSL